MPLKTKLTLRYIGMVILSTLLLLGLGFTVLTNIENNIRPDSLPGTFAYNFDNEIELDDEGNVAISEKGQQTLLEQNAWIQFIDEEGYAIGGFNEPSYVSDHYSPVEIVHLNMYSTNHSDDIYYTGKVNEEINFLMALPSETWRRKILEFDDQWFIQFFQIMSIIAVIVFVVIGYIFSRRIAKPVTQIIEGVERLADDDYNADYKEKGLYGSVFASLNKLANNLKVSLHERQKTMKQREDWIANISHDLKTPLSSIKGYSELLVDPDYQFSEEEVRNFSEKILQKSNYMENMIEELRLNEKLMNEAVQLKKEKGNFTRFIEEIIKDIVSYPDYSNRKIIFESDPGNIEYSFDQDLMKRCLENLIYNSLIHNDEETTIHIRLNKIGNEIHLKIIDNGMGMKEEDLENLFNRYYRGTNTTNHKGSGLGMSIAKEVIEAHDGKINVESQVNKGTKVKVIL